MGKKLVCEYLANGTVEQEAEQLICARFSQVAICDSIVKILWTDLENVCAPTTTSAASGIASAESLPQSVFDEIKKLVCEYLANGVVEQEAEQLICARFSQVAICDPIVKILWTDLENVCAPTTTSAGSVVV